jgi:hypothetical protein
MNIKFLVSGFLFLAVGHLVTAQSVSKGYYDNHANGFYLSHFDAVGARTGCAAYNLRLSRGGQPKLDGHAWREKFKDEKIDYVLDLRSEASSGEETAVRAQGWGYILLPLKTSGTRQPAQLRLRIAEPGQEVHQQLLDPVEATLEVLRKVDTLTREGHRVYIHCQRGEDRTGTFLGLLRKCTDWRTEFRRYGGSVYPSLTWLFNEVSARRDEY